MESQRPEGRHDKIALVTGGAHPMGIGYASALALVRLGFDVVVTGISSAEIAMTPKSPGISTAVLDVTDDKSVAELIATLPRLDALVNCAGTANFGEFEAAGFQRTVDVNLVGMMRVCVA
jgi:NAD(P)-dependent dehydrogenase (short-subunit alcohol dehydrogenase family)